MRLRRNVFAKISGVALSILAAFSITVSIVQTCHAITDRVIIDTTRTSPVQESGLFSEGLSGSQSIPGFCVGVASLILLANRKNLKPKNAKSEFSVVNAINLRRYFSLVGQRYSFSLSPSQLGISRT